MESNIFSVLELSDKNKLLFFLCLDHIRTALAISGRCKHIVMYQNQGMI